MAAMTKNAEVAIFPDSHALFQFAAKDFSQRATVAVSKNGNFSVVLAGGKTPELFFDVLSSVAQYKENIPWDKIQFFFGDERYVPSNDSESNYHMAYEHLFSKLPINPKNVFRIPTDFKDPKSATHEYERILRTFSKNNDGPQFDLVYLGLGENGHTASLMPLSEIVKYYAENPLAAKNSNLVVSLYDSESEMYRISLTPSALNNGMDIIFLVTGANKKNAVSEVLNGNRDPLHYPAQLIHSIHGQTIWYLDAAAAGKLEI
jgi:6-phosphogluconolactonase